MGLTGIQIFKLLPKTNCGECGVPTCLAFAMALAAGKAELDKCPYVSEAAKEQLSESSAPPVRPLTVGTGDYAVKVGGETVMFRHEKTFVNKPGLALLITTDMDDAAVKGRIDKLHRFQFERVGLKLRAEALALKDTKGDPAAFAALVNEVKGASQAALILMSDKPEVLSAGVKACADRKPLIYAATAATADALGALAKETGCPLAVRSGDGYDGLITLTQKLTGMGLKDLVLDLGARTIKQALTDQIVVRRAATKQIFRPLGFPTIAFPCEMADNLLDETLIAGMFIAKYAGFIVMSDLEAYSLFPLLLQRLNIYTDPQRPMTAAPGIYPIGNPNENSPVLVTCNFSLTYFIVSGEIEGSRVPSWLCVTDTEGLSVMTAWAAGKFSGESVGAFIRKCGIGDKVKHKNLVIPGYAAGISGELEEELPGWKILVGPRDAANIPKYLKSWQPR
ncbi:MAG TPA: acetyl-CoA decarbonylase/synthase complex subunit gamma [Syntrophobacteria bacterium]|nr:acetyl-CoA decarbonylase/synthase complex subunit gamma [Syntrophobacteria bacterium]